MQQTSNSTDKRIQCLYAAWQEAELEALRIFDEVKEDYAHPRYIAAHDAAHAMLMELLRPSSSLHAALVKLKIAVYFEDYLKDVEDPNCRVVAPRAVVSAMRDLENLVAAGNSAA